MATDESTQNPFTRPGFVAAAIVVALLVVLGVVIAIVNATRAESTPEPTPSASPASTTSSPSQPPEASPTDVAASICGLKDDADAKPPAAAPEALWEYQGTTAYPASETYGPGKNDAAGFRYCFQHSPTGALFAAANAAAQGSDPEVSPKWLDYAVAEGPYREELVSSVATGSGKEGSRITIQGFRILKYDGSSARVDLGVRGSSGGETVMASAVYELVWQEGDWKINADMPEPLDTAPIPDLTGYIAWGE